MHDLSDLDEPRLVDGIVLTKFDTIDDKVGAALSMVYCTGKPIVFVGTGQKYTNLKRLNVKDVVNLLLNCCVCWRGGICKKEEKEKR